MTITNLINFLTIISFTLVTSRITRIIGKSVKTVKTEYGVIYDCVDFYEQPAFQHPLLKNHSFHPQMKPSSRPKWMTSRWSGLQKDYFDTSYFQFKDGGCPKNTVPIRRINEEDIAQVNLLSKNLVSQLEPGTYRAIAQTQPNPSTTIYNGIGAWFSIWNPSTVAYQYSSSQFLIQNGLDSIQVGWTVNPILYKDNKTHMFIHTTTASGSHCFNTLCPGFVLVRSEYPPDMNIPLISTKGGTIREIAFFVYKDEANGNWWLQIGKSGIPIGFWPNQIFTGLKQSGSYLECGGETYSPPDKSGGPPMGTGSRILGRGDVAWDAYCSNFITVNEQHKIVDVDNTQEFCNSDKYEVKDVGHEIEKMGHILFFGGPGR